MSEWFTWNSFTHFHSFNRSLVRSFFIYLFLFLVPHQKLLSFAIATDKFARITSGRLQKKGDFKSDKEVARLARFLLTFRGKF